MTYSMNFCHILKMRVLWVGWLVTRTLGTTNLLKLYVTLYTHVHFWGKRYRKLLTESQKDRSWKQIKNFTSMFFVDFTQMCIPALIRWAHCGNKKRPLISLKLLKRNLFHSFYLLRLLCDLYYLLCKGNDVKIFT